MSELPTPTFDGLITPEVGAWSRNKHYFLRRYIDAFTTAMRNKWGELHYIDLFAGAGIERIKDGDLDWGSPLIAAYAHHRFTKLHLCELNQQKFNALQKRLEQIPQPTPPQILRGDSNLLVREIMDSVPQNALSLAFLDPFGLHLNFTTLAVLAEKKVDLIIFFPDHSDALRNWQMHYEDNPDSNLDRFLGSGEWRKRKAASSPDQWADVLKRLYEDQIRTLGYVEFNYERINRTGGSPLYRLVFCSKDKAGGKIWKGISQKLSDGQGQFQW